MDVLKRQKGQRNPKGSSKRENDETKKKKKRMEWGVKFLKEGIHNPDSRF